MHIGDNLWCIGLDQIFFKFAHYSKLIIVHLSTPLFKRKLSIILKKADKIQMKHEYDQNVHVHFGQQVLDYMQFFFFCKYWG